MTLSPPVHVLAAERECTKGFDCMRSMCHYVCVCVSVCLCLFRCVCLGLCLCLCLCLCLYCAPRQETHTERPSSRL